MRETEFKRTKAVERAIEAKRLDPRVVPQAKTSARRAKEATEYECVVGKKEKNSP